MVMAIVVTEVIMERERLDGELSKDIVSENSSIGGTILRGNSYISVASKYSVTPNVFLF